MSAENEACETPYIEITVVDRLHGTLDPVDIKMRVLDMELLHHPAIAVAFKQIINILKDVDNLCQAVKQIQHFENLYHE